jgi:hypothetical protein
MKGGYGGKSGGYPFYSWCFMESTSFQVMELAMEGGNGYKKWDILGVYLLSLLLHRPLFATPLKFTTPAFLLYDNCMSCHSSLS